MTDVYLETVGLTCERDWRVLFTHLDLQIRPGQMIQVSGPNGSGKTSLLRLLAGLMQPTAGRILVQGVDLSRQRYELSINSLWMGHATGVKGLLTAEENLNWLTALQRGATAQEITQALAQVGLKGFHDMPCHTLSAGQQRRVGLARLHLPDPPRLWILDEPFTALDKHAVADLERHLARHCEQAGMVIFTTHHELQYRPQQFMEIDLGQRNL